jgi:glutathione S-transferase
VIVEFLDSVSPISKLIPEGTRDRLAVRRWEALADGVTDAGILMRYESLRDKSEQSPAWSAKQLARMQRGMAQMAAELGERSCCHGERYSLADIALGCCLGWLDFRRPGGVDWRKDYPVLARHYDRMLERPAFADTVPAVPK